MIVRNHLPALVAAIAATCVFKTQAASDSTEMDRTFALKVYPLLKSKCFACHGEDPAKIKGELDLTKREHMLKGGEVSDKVLVPGKAAESDLYRAVTWEDPDLEMPPKENDRLTSEQVALVKEWIDAGAPWVEADQRESFLAEERHQLETDEGLIVKTSGGLGDEWTYRRYKREDIWAFLPVEKPEVPADAHPVDTFIDAKRQAAGFEPAPLADARTLVRRIHLDLTGLPPSTEAMAHWSAKLDVTDEKAHRERVGDLVDKLLESPHYGERWAQHWLDIARYSDTGGYSNDYERSNAWRYRDYVIRAFNEDKPYNEFVIEQLAGDELADASVSRRVQSNEEKVKQVRMKGEYTPEESEWIVATGFLRMGAWDNAMVMPDEARQIYLDDVVNSVGQTFLATTMRCCKCHDHKFDPIPTRDYYRLYAAFAGTQMAERPAPFVGCESQEGFESGRAHVERLLEFATTEKDKIKAKQEAAAKKWFDERGLPYISEDDRKDLPDEAKPPRHVGLDYIDEGQLKVREQDEWIWERRLERYKPMAQSVYNGEANPDRWNRARKLRMNPKPDPDWQPVSKIYMGGSLQAPGDEVSPGVLSAIGLPADSEKENDPYALPKGVTGRRLALAKWVAHPDNSLTTRSIVNRLWQHHFTKPLAGNPTNFGVKGLKPTHPKLLDWLAADLVEHGWKIKRLHRVIMTSRAYRQAGNHSQMEALATKDPNNDLIAYFPPRRLTAEEIRDQLLAVTGELNSQIGGLPIMPEINMEVALQPRMIQFSIAPAHQPSPTPQERNRRTIYAYRVRGLPDPFLELFNQPNPNDSCEVRDAASVTPQAFTLLNSDVMSDRAIAFALALEKTSPDLSEQIEHGFQRALGRQPKPDESVRMLEYVGEMQAYHRGVQPEPVVYPKKINRSLVEEFSGKPFPYDEILPVFENYQPDTKPADVSPETRALADFCLLLFNTNEFAFVY